MMVTITGDVLRDLRISSPLSRHHYLVTRISSLVYLVGGADSLHRLARELVVEIPGRAGDTDAADAFAVDDDRVAAFHRRPASGPGGEREAERVHRVERLSRRALRGRRPLVRRGAHGLGGRG